MNKKKDFFKNIVLVISGIAGAQAIALAFTPLITRIYGPENYGILGTFVSLVSIVSPIIALTLPMAIVLPKTDKEAIAICKLSLIISFLFSFIIGVGLFFKGSFIFNQLNAGSINNFWFLIPLSVFFYGTKDIQLQWLIRKGKFNLYARASLFQSLFNNGLKTGIGILYSSAFVLVLLQALVDFVYSIILIFFTRGICFFKKNTNKYTYRFLLEKYYDFIIYRAPQVVLNSLSFSIPVLFLGYYFNSTSVGFYTLSRMLMIAPQNLIGQSISNVFYPKFVSSLNNKVSIYGFYKKIIFYLAGVSFLPYLIIFLYGDNIFPVVFGKEWGEAGVYAGWISIWLFFSTCARPAIATIPALHLQRFFLVFEVIFLILKISVLYLGYYEFNNAISSIMLYSLISAFSYLYLSVYCLIIYRNKVK